MGYFENIFIPLASQFNGTVNVFIQNINVMELEANEKAEIQNPFGCDDEFIYLCVCESISYWRVNRLEPNEQIAYRLGGGGKSEFVCDKHISIKYLPIFSPAFKITDSVQFDASTLLGNSIEWLYFYANRFFSILLWSSFYMIFAF